MCPKKKIVKKLTCHSHYLTERAFFFFLNFLYIYIYVCVRARVKVSFKKKKLDIHLNLTWQHGFAQLVKYLIVE